jgi:hypothetical protein
MRGDWNLDALQQARAQNDEVFLDDESRPVNKIKQQSCVGICFVSARLGGVSGIFFLFGFLAIREKTDTNFIVRSRDVIVSSLKSIIEVLSASYKWFSSIPTPSPRRLASPRPSPTCTRSRRARRARRPCGPRCCRCARVGAAAARDGLDRPA